jgi:hypothetical protein
MAEKVQKAEQGHSLLREERKRRGKRKASQQNEEKEAP